MHSPMAVMETTMETFPATPLAATVTEPYPASIWFMNMWEMLIMIVLQARSSPSVTMGTITSLFNDRFLIFRENAFFFFLPRTRADNSVSEYEYCQTFFLAGLTAILQKWLDSGCLESEEELLQFLTKQFSFCQQLLSLSHEKELTIILKP